MNMLDRELSAEAIDILFDCSEHGTWKYYNWDVFSYMNATEMENKKLIKRKQNYLII